MMRFHPLIVKVKEMIENNTYGRLISITDKWGDYLPNWHTWEDYRLSYAAKKDLGGGVALTLSHDIDLVNWLSQSTLSAVKTIRNFRSLLETEVESGFDALLKHKNGITANVHLNFYEQTPERYLKLVFDKASVSFEYFKNELIVKDALGNINEVQTLNNFDRNDMFIDQLVYFFNKLNNYDLSESMVQIEESEEIINICLNE